MFTTAFSWEVSRLLPALNNGFKYEKPKAKLPLAKTMPEMPLVQTGNYWVPKQIITMIFRRSPPDALLNIGLVCKLWYQLSSCDSLWMSYTLREAFPQATFIDRNIWETYVDVKKYGWEMEEKGRPCVTKWDYIELKGMESQVEGDLGLTIVTLYKKHKLKDPIDFAESGKAGNSTAVSFIQQSIIKRFGNMEVKETIVVAVTNNVFKNSKKRGKLKCDKPSLLATIAVALMRFRTSDPANPTRLFSGGPPTYTCLEEEIDGAKLVFRGFAHGGPGVFIDRGDKDYGLAGQWQFKVCPIV